MIIGESKVVSAALARKDEEKHYKKYMTYTKNSDREALILYSILFCRKTEGEDMQKWTHQVSMNFKDFAPIWSKEIEY